MQIWTNIWVKRDSSTIESDYYYSTAKSSYDDAMEDLTESGEQFCVPALKWNPKTKKNESYRQYYDYLCTQYTEIDGKGNVVECKSFTGMTADIESWQSEQASETLAYKSAGKLSHNQMFGRAA